MTKNGIVQHVYTYMLKENTINIFKVSICYLFITQITKLQHSSEKDEFPVYD